jgi:formylglycine-generating enzyme required for sulfatase activity
VATGEIPRVFISSTLEDLKDLTEFREAADAAIRRRDWLPINCGYWAAGGHPPLQTCLERVDEADVVLVIVAHRHGWTPPDQAAGEHKSITRLECERAHARGIEVIPFIVDDKAPWDAKLTEAYRIHQAKPEEIASVAAEVTRNVQALKEFKSWLDKIGTRVLFSYAKDLETEVLDALVDWGKRAGFSKPVATNAAVRARYLEWLRRNCERVELLGLDLKDAQNVRLGQVYVPAVTSVRENGELQRVQGAWHEPRHALLLHHLGEESLYVPGAPGAGKSTFCRWVALCAATGAIPVHPIGALDPFKEQLPQSLRDRFPILCRLREWTGHTECLAGNGHWTRAQLENALACWIAAAKPGGLTPEVFREELAQGHCLLIIDGVDEVPEAIDKHLPRRNLLTGLTDALPDWLGAGNRVLLTSRPYGLDEAQRSRLCLPVAELAELPGELQDTFIRRWYAAADPARAKEKSQGLIEHLDERRDLDELRPNPMLLTALCIKFDEGQRLPKDFYRLYNSVVSQVLHKRYLTANERDRAHRRLAAVALGMHNGTPARPRTTPEAEVSIDELDRTLAALAQSDWATEAGGEAAAIGREDLLSNSGLLLPRRDCRAAFYHLSFQEFFAAVRLRRIDTMIEAILEEHAGTPAWRRTLTFLFCAVADQDSEESAALAYASLLPRLESHRLVENPNPALLLADCLEVAHARGWNLTRFADGYRHGCDHALHHLAPPERAHLWRTLGKLGLDDRPGVGVKDGLPDIDWLEVPNGEFIYGEEKVQISLDAFRIARYPITNAQFQWFIDDGGYETDTWWRAPAERPKPERPHWNYPNHPREMVSWYEAMAFCCWLDARSRERRMLPKGLEVRLPTEEEWEKAARGTDGREFPWGNYESGYANIDERHQDAGPYHLGQTTAVGLYPLGASPYGAMDMAGNVWEWCLSKSGNLDDVPSSGGDPRMFRGGGWVNDRVDARCAYRNASPSFTRDDLIGFRVVCGVPTCCRRGAPSDRRRLA